MRRAEEKFQDEHNSRQVQANRIERWRLASLEYLAEHGTDCLPPFGDFLQAMAHSPRGSGPGKDGIPAEVWLDSPFSLKIQLHDLLRRRTMGLIVRAGLHWQMVVLHVIG